MRGAWWGSVLLGFGLGSPGFHGKMVRGIDFLAVMGNDLAAGFVVVGTADVVRGNGGVESIVRIRTEGNARKATLFDGRRSGTDGLAFDGVLSWVGAVTWHGAWVSAYWWVRRIGALVHGDVVARGSRWWHILVASRASAGRMLLNRWLIWRNWGTVTRVLLVVVSNLGVYWLSVSSGVLVLVHALRDLLGDARVNAGDQRNRHRRRLIAVRMVFEATLIRLISLVVLLRVM